jgi:hypothetical protein
LNIRRHLRHPVDQGGGRKLDSYCTETVSFRDVLSGIAGACLLAAYQPQQRL